MFFARSHKHSAYTNYYHCFGLNIIFTNEKRQYRIVLSVCFDLLCERQTSTTVLYGTEHQNRILLHNLSLPPFTLC